MATTVSKLAIYNMALGFVGTRTIASENEHTPEAVQCELYWDRARRAALRDFPYAFAQQRFRLAEKPMPDVYQPLWLHAYGVPAQSLKIVRVEDEQGRKRVDFALCQDRNGVLLLLCNQENAMAMCTVDVENVQLWDELFVVAMAYRLAMFIAVPLLKNNSQKMQELAQLYQAVLPSTEGHSANEQRDRQRLDPWLVARGVW